MRSAIFPNCGASVPCLGPEEAQRASSKAVRSQAGRSCCRSRASFHFRAHHNCESHKCHHSLHDQHEARWHEAGNYCGPNRRHNSHEFHRRPRWSRRKARRHCRQRRPREQARNSRKARHGHSCFRQSNASRQNSRTQGRRPREHASQRPNSLGR